METRQLTINEAACELGVTRRTVECRIQKGDIVASWGNVKRYIRISGTNTTVPTVSHDISPTPSNKDIEIVTLRTELEMIRQERDYLRQHVSELTLMLHRIGDQKAIESSTAAPGSKPQRATIPWFKRLLG